MISACSAFLVVYLRGFQPDREALETGFFEGGLSEEDIMRFLERVFRVPPQVDSDETGARLG